jgi:mono/diheme cytochrome c family protein
MKITWPMWATVALTGLLLLSCSRTDTDAPAELAAASPEPPTADAAAATVPEVQAPHPGEALYLANCASCHDQAVYKAPSLQPATSRTDLIPL